MCEQRRDRHRERPERDRQSGLQGAISPEILTWLDDCTRFALQITAHHRVTGSIVLTEFRRTVATHGIPASTLTDNGMVFTTRLAGGKGGRNPLETELRRLGVDQKNGRPWHPQTQGKVERFQQTMKKWLRTQPDQPATIADLQILLDTFAEEYNKQTAAQVPGASSHTGHDLHQPTQGHTRRPHR